MSTDIQNIIYIHTHDMGRYISPYGYAVPTPQLERFAQGATTFRKAFCCGPTCSPSRAGLLTGMTPHQTGMLGLAHRGFELEHPELHMAAYLQSQGYYTALCGIQHEFDEDRDQMAYDFVDEAHRGLGDFAEDDRLSTEAAVNFLRRDHKQPFFLSFGLFYPHRPFMKTDDQTPDAGKVLPPAPLPDTAEVRQDMAQYHRTMSHSDACLGDVFQAIRESGHDQDSLVIVTTDHGIAFPKMKCNLHDSGIGVTLMISYPGNTCAGQSCDALVSQLDVFPTVCDLLELEAPAHLQGNSLRPLFEKRETEVRTALFAEVNFHVDYEPSRCIRTNRYKLIRRFDPSELSLPNCDNSPSKEVLVDNGWTDMPREQLELYDLLLDPNEGSNLAHSSAHQTVLHKLLEQLDTWMQETHDPLLDGAIPMPPLAVKKMQN